MKFRVGSPKITLLTAFAKRSSLAIAVMTCLYSSPVLAQTYDFESLSYGSIIGQDGWTSYFGDGSIANGTGVNTSRVLMGPSNIVALVRDRGVTPTLANSSVLEFDSTLAGNGGALSIFALSNASGDNAMAFGLESGSSSIPNFFLFRRSSYFAGNTRITLPTGSSGDWYRLRMVFDFAANGGDGSVSGFWKDLTLGQATFTPFAPFQNVNLGLTAPNLVSAQPLTWSMFEVRADAGAELDNLYAGVKTTATPESGSLSLLATGVASSMVFVLFRRRNAKLAKQ